MRASRRRAWALALLGAALIALGGWCAFAGPVTVFRIVYYNASGIDDHRDFPARALQASATPYRFERAAHAAPLQVPQGDGTRAPLAEVLAANDTVAFVVVQDDRLVDERYYGSHRAESIALLFSLSKSIFALLIGAAIDDGLIRSPEQRITDLVPELAARGFSVVTIAQLLQMTSGSDYVENDNPFGVHARYYYTDHLADEILRQRVIDVPGTRWRYKSGDTALLGLALARAVAPRTITAYAQERLWSPLGMEFDAKWLIDRAPDGLERTWCCLAAAARDVAKLGRLMLRRGEWNGRQVVSPQWIDRLTGSAPDAALALGPEFTGRGLAGYASHWWLGTQPGDYVATGHLGQFLYVSPAHRSVVVRLGRSQGRLSTGDWLRLLRSVASHPD